MWVFFKGKVGLVQSKYFASRVLKMIFIASKWFKSSQNQEIMFGNLTNNNVLISIGIFQSVFLKVADVLSFIV